MIHPEANHASIDIEPQIVEEPHESSETATTTTTATTTIAVTATLEAIVEGVQDAFEHARVVATDIAGDVYYDVGEALQSELQEADDGDKYFMEMQLVRNLSLLPSDLADAAAAINATEPDETTHFLRILPNRIPATDTVSTYASTGSDDDSYHFKGRDRHHQVENMRLLFDPPIENFAPPQPTGLSKYQSINDTSSDETNCNIEFDDIAKKAESAHTTTVIATPLFAYMLLATAIVCLSSIGPFYVMQKDCTQSMKLYWRMQATALFLLPASIHSSWKTGLPQLTSAQWFTFGMASASYALCCLTFIMSLSYTSVANAVILSNSQALLFLMGRLLIGSHISRLEGMGAFLAFAGAVLCSWDGVSTSTSDDNTGFSTNWHTPLLGDMLGLISAIAGCGYLVFAKSVRIHVAVEPFVFMIMFCGSFMVIIVVVVVLQEPVTLDMNINHGVFGWLNLRHDRLPLELLTVVLCNVLGTLGYVRAMQYFDNLVISVAGLVEPVVACLFLAAFGGMLPGPMGWIGNALVVGGTVAVVHPANATAKLVAALKAKTRGLELQQ
jgi:drug/metabolite transporter (DMT)-like permease